MIMSGVVQANSLNLWPRQDVDIFQKLRFTKLSLVCVCVNKLVVQKKSAPRLPFLRSVAIITRNPMMSTGFGIVPLFIIFSCSPDKVKLLPAW